MAEFRTEVKIALVCDALRKAGYTKFWVGPNPHWTNADKSMIVAEPAHHGKDGWPALWRALNGMYTSSCGNGLGKADQQQYANLDLPVGEYDLTEGRHG